MKESIKHALALSETRERLNVITALPDADVTDTIRAEEGTARGEAASARTGIPARRCGQSPRADTHVTRPTPKPASACAWSTAPTWARSSRPC